jgi:hypothetical protein
MADWPILHLHGQDSFHCRARSVDVALSVTGAMLGPVTFFPEEQSPIRPYAIAPWATEPMPADLPPMLRALRGDWFCSAFGGNAEPHRGRRLPPHGETANLRWSGVDRGESAAGCWLRLAVDLPVQGGRCHATTVLLHEHSIIYQRHDLSGLDGPLNPGHHATLSFPDVQGAGRLSFSRSALMHSYIAPTELPSNRGYSWLKASTRIATLDAALCIDGSTTDLSRYPARRGFEDIVIICADPAAALGWSAATFADDGFVWFALRNPRQLASTLLWFSNGGRHYPPWNGRHTNVLGMEDVTAFFHEGIAASCRPNLLTESGIRTCIEPDARGCLSIPYIQGVVRIPATFDVVATIEPEPDGRHIRLIAQSGAAVSTACHVGFVHTGQIPGMAIPRG